MEPLITIPASEMRKVEQKESLKKLQREQQKAASGDKSAVQETQANRDRKVKVRSYEKHLIHVAVNTQTVDNENKKIHDERRVLKIQPRNFDQMIKDGAFAAFDEASVIHDPRENAPKEYNLRPAIPATPASPANDAALAAREQQLKDRERMLREAEARLDEKLATINKAQSQVKPQEQTGKVTGSPVAKKQNEGGTDVPPPPQV